MHLAYLRHVREGLINSPFSSEICFSGDSQVKLGGSRSSEGRFRGEAPVCWPVARLRPTVSLLLPQAAVVRRIDSPTHG